MSIPAMKSVLLGNGININFGGRAYTNEFIIKRIIFNARAGKYAPLFHNEISGDDIATLFFGLAKWTNEIVSGQYDSCIIDDLDVKALMSFKARYNWALRHYYEVGLEDWFFILRVYFLSNPDMTAQWNSAKQGFEHMMLDAIYNDGEIQYLYTKMGKPVRKFLSSFSTLFTLNYDCNIETLTKKAVIHLHGDYKTPANSENPSTIQGFCRAQKGCNVVIHQFEHCYCNALLDYCGEHKYDIASAFEKGEQGLTELEKRKIRDEYLPAPISEWIEVHREHPELSFGVQYHFDALRKLSGELYIIGLSPNNDSHIFKLINESGISKVIYFYHSQDDKKLSLRKPLEFRRVDELWKSLDAAPKKYNCRYNIPDSEEVDKFLHVFNVLSGDPVSKETLKKEIDAIPQFTADRLCQIAYDKLVEMRSFGSPKSEEELLKQCREVSRIALREGVLPSALYAHVIMNAGKWNSDGNA